MTEYSRLKEFVKMEAASDVDSTQMTLKRTTSWISKVEQPPNGAVRECTDAHFSPNQSLLGESIQEQHGMHFLATLSASLLDPTARGLELHSHLNELHQSRLANLNNADNNSDSKLELHTSAPKQSPDLLTYTLCTTKNRPYFNKRKQAWSACSTVLDIEMKPTWIWSNPQTKTPYTNL